MHAVEKVWLARPPSGISTLICAWTCPMLHALLFCVEQVGLELLGRQLQELQEVALEDWLLRLRIGNRRPCFSFTLNSFCQRTS